MLGFDDAPRTVFLPCLQARDARHHGRYGLEGLFYARPSVAIPQVQFLDEVVVPVVYSDICPGPATQYSGSAAVAVPRLVCRFLSRGPYSALSLVRYSGYMRCVSLRGFLEVFRGCPDSAEVRYDSACVLGQGC